LKLSSLRRPFVCLVVSEASCDGAISIIEDNEDRVDAFEVNLTLLDSRGLREVFAATKRPCLATSRRPNFMKFYGYHDLPPVSEESRAEKLIYAVNAGADAIDCELDMFDEVRQSEKPAYLSREEKAYALKPASEPAELSRDRMPVAKQKRLALQAKNVGAEVVFSCHTQTVITKTQGSEILSAMQRRGADLGKIVSLTFGPGDLAPFVETVVLLKRSSRIPFNLMNVGSESILGRLLSVGLGSSWTYCRPDSGVGYSGQPTVDQVRTFFRMMGLG
jgi:3-dehydroquinate dehydratase